MAPFVPDPCPDTGVSPANVGQKPVLLSLKQLIIPVSSALRFAGANTASARRAGGDRPNPNITTTSSSNRPKVNLPAAVLAAAMASPRRRSRRRAMAASGLQVAPCAVGVVGDGGMAGRMAVLLTMRTATRAAVVVAVVGAAVVAAAVVAARAVRAGCARCIATVPVR